MHELRTPGAVRGDELPQLIKEDFFFVDHTRYLRELEKYKTPVFLRPKRFGKSLWVSMLEHYYDVRFDNLLGCPNLYTQKLFDSLVQDPNWTHGREVEVVIVEVAGNRGYNWHTLQA